MTLPQLKTNDNVNTQYQGIKVRTCAFRATTAELWWRDFFIELVR